MNVDEIRERYQRALDAKPSKGDYTPAGIDALTDSVCDIPELLVELGDLLAEVDRLAARALPDPKGGCVCESYSEDRGGGYFESMVEYEPACPEHAVHVYNPRSGVWEFDATARAEAAEQAIQRVREFAEQGREFADRTMDDAAAHWARSAADGIIRALDGGEQHG